MPKRRRLRKLSRGRISRPTIPIEVVFDRETRMFVAVRGDDLGTPERHARGGVEVVDRTVTEGGVVRGRGAVAVAENLLSGLLHAGALHDPTRNAPRDPRRKETIDDGRRRYDAGETFRNLWRKAGLDQNPRSCLQEVIPGKAEMSGAAEAAYGRVQSAMRALGQDASFAVELACKGRWPGVSALPRSRDVLSVLADHFKL